MSKKLAMIFSCLLLFLSDKSILRADEIKEEFIQECPKIGIIIGFGAGSKIDRPQIEIKKIFRGSPAQKTGLLLKDKILAINGIPIEDIGAKKIAEIDLPETKKTEKLIQVKNEIQRRFETENSVTLRIKRVGCIEEENEKSDSDRSPSIGLLSIDFTIEKEDGKR